MQKKSAHSISLIINSINFCPCEFSTLLISWFRYTDIWISWFFTSTLLRKHDLKKLKSFGHLCWAHLGSHIILWTFSVDQMMYPYDFFNGPYPNKTSKHLHSHTHKLSNFEAFFPTFHHCMYSFSSFIFFLSLLPPSFDSYIGAML